MTLRYRCLVRFCALVFLPGCGAAHANHDRYEGTFRAGTQSGAGANLFANGDNYAGSFEAGVRHGKGVHTFANGQQKQMEYVNRAEKPN